MPRFFIQDTPSGEYLLSGEPGRHGAKVLRLRPGEEVTLCDGRGADYICTVRENTGESLLLDVGKAVTSRGEPRVKITVCQCLPKGDKLTPPSGQKFVGWSYTEDNGKTTIYPAENYFYVEKNPTTLTARYIPTSQTMYLVETYMQNANGDYEQEDTEVRIRQHPATSSLHQTRCPGIRSIPANQSSA